MSPEEWQTAQDIADGSGFEQRWAEEPDAAQALIVALVAELREIRKDRDNERAWANAYRKKLHDLGYD